MAKIKSVIIYTALLCVILGMFIGEVEGRRKILRGRKTITRTYYRKSAIPAWATVTIVAFSMIIVGGIVYAVMRKIIISAPPANSYAPASQIEP